MKAEYTMPVIKAYVSAAEFDKVEALKKKLKKPKTTIMREALEDYIIKHENFERGLDLRYVRTDKHG